MNVISGLRLGAFLLLLPTCLLSGRVTAARAEGPGRGLVARWAFDEGRGPVARDSTGGGHHLRFARALGAPGGPGRIGRGRPVAPTWVRGVSGTALRIGPRGVRCSMPAGRSLMPAADPWTVAAWVRTTRPGGTVVFAGVPDADRYALRVKEGRAVFEVAMSRGPGSVVRSTTLVADGRWHLLVGVRSRERRIQLYVDGVLHASLETAGGTNIFAGGAFHFGSFAGEDRFVGEVDELRLYRRALSAEEVRALAGAGARAKAASSPGPEQPLSATGRAGPAGVDMDARLAEIGDEPSIEEMLNVIEIVAASRRGGEKAKPGTPAPGARTRRSPERSPGRTLAGLVALFDFSKTQGRLVPDRSGVQPPAHLRIERLSEARPVPAPGGLRIAGPTRIASAAPSPKLNRHIRETGRFSAEVWFRPADVRQGGPARVLSLSRDGSNCNFTVGQSKSSVVFRLRTTNTSKVGTPSLNTEPGTLTGAPVHVVCTFDGLASRVYVDGKLRAEKQPGGDLSNWSDYHLVVANEFADRRDWLGTVYLAAVYDRALSPAEVLRSYAVGLRIVGLGPSAP